MSMVGMKRSDQWNMRNRARMALTHEDVKKILEIVDSAEHLDVLDLDYNGLHLRLQRSAAPSQALAPSSRAATAPAIASAATQAASAPAAPAATPAATPTQPQPALGAGDVAIRAPMLGTFYRSPSPGEPAFVEVGQRVRADDTVCLIEVMKLFSSIKAGVDGVVKQIAAGNGELVEFDQVLIVVTAGA